MAEHNVMTFQFTPKPNPLAIGESGEICLQIQETGTERKNVHELLLEVPCGEDAASVFRSVSDVGIYTEESDRWECGRDRIQEESADAPAYVHISSNKKAGDSMDSPAVFHITGKVASEPGNARIDVTVTFTDETSESDSAYITKGGGELYLENFLARSKDKTEVPTAVFRKNEPIYLSWNSNGDFFRLYASGASKPLAETTDTTFVLEGGAGEDTTYILQAAKPSVSSTCLYRTLTIHIQDPSLESLEIREQLKTDQAVLTVLGEPSEVPLEKVRQYMDWVLVPETDGYLVGNLKFKAGVEGNGTLTVRECNQNQKHCYEVSDMAFQGNVLRPDKNSAWELSKEASVCVPVRKNVMVMVSLRIFHISQKGEYNLSIHFVPMGKGEIVQY